MCYVFKFGRGSVIMVCHQKLENNDLFSILSVCFVFIIMEIYVWSPIRHSNRAGN